MRKFKSLICIILVVAMMFTTLGIVSSANTERLVGDCNNDGNINGKDVLLLRKHIVGLEYVDNTDYADCNGDGNINGKDVLLLRKYIVGLASELATLKPATTTPPTQGELNGAGEAVPSSYSTELCTQITINQIGYSTYASKTAKLFESSGISKDDSQIAKVDVYLIDAKTGKTIMKATTKNRGYDTPSDKYVVEFDFSDCITNGTYYIAAPAGRSYEFVIDSNPYEELNDALLTMQYYQRCGTALDSEIVGNYAHSACHTGDAYPAKILNKDNGTVYVQSDVKTATDFEGGLHDAGDYGRYTTPAVQVVADLIYSYVMFPDALDLDIIQDNAGENISDALDEARYEAEWLLKMQAEDGGVYWKATTIQHANFAQPDKDNYFLHGTYDGSHNASQYGLYVSRVMYESTAGAAGAFATCYVAFKDIDKDFANECLAAAKKAYNWCMQDSAALPRGAKKAFDSIGSNPSIGTGSYGGTACNEALWYAACSLYAATGDKTYSDKIDAMITAGTCNYTGMTAYNFGGFGSVAYLLYDKGDSTIKQNILAAFVSAADTYKANSKTNRWDSIYSGAGMYNWGSNQGICCAMKMCIVADYFNGTDTYEETVRNVMSFILGRNWSEYSFVTGYGSKTPLNPHHRPSWGKTPVPGMLVGGIYQGSYVDSKDDYVRNEICVYWNSSASYVMSYIVNADING